MAVSNRVVYREYGSGAEVEAEALSLPPAQQKVRVQISRKGRNGKTVTVVSGLTAPPEALKDLLKKLKHVCGAGGTLRDGVIEIQGEHIEKLVASLMQLGYSQCKGAK